MRIFITGSNGFIGAAVIKELLANGHEVIGLVRSDAASQEVEALGATTVRGTTEDIRLLEITARDVDGVIHLAYMHRWGQASRSRRLGIFFGGAPSRIGLRFATAGASIDRAAIQALGVGLQGSGKPLITVFALMGMAPGDEAIESDSFAPQSVGAVRSKNEQLVLDLAAQDIRSVVTRFPLFVHGAGDDSGFAAQAVASAKRSGFSGYEGEGTNRLPAVHVSDAARLLRLAIEDAEPGTVIHGVGESGVAMKDIAQAIGARLGLPVKSLDEKEAKRHFSFNSMFLRVDNPSSSRLTAEKLRWRPNGPTLVEDIETTYS